MADGVEAHRELFLPLDEARPLLPTGFLKHPPPTLTATRFRGCKGRSTLWRFLASLHLNVAKQMLTVQRWMRERVWAAAPVVTR